MIIQNVNFIIIPILKKEEIQLLKGMKYVQKE